MTRALFVVAAALVLSPLVANTQEKPVTAADPLLGTWQMSGVYSSFLPGPAPASRTRTYEAHPVGVKETVRTVLADGSTTTVEAVYAYQGEHRVTGSTEVGAIRATRVSAREHEAILLRAGKQVGSFRRAISENGLRMTVTTRMSGPRPTDDVEVYEKAAP